MESLEGALWVGAAMRANAMPRPEPTTTVLFRIVDDSWAVFPSVGDKKHNIQALFNKATASEHERARAAFTGYDNLDKQYAACVALRKAAEAAMPPASMGAAAEAVPVNNAVLAILQQHWMAVRAAAGGVARNRKLSSEGKLPSLDLERTAFFEYLENPATKTHNKMLNTYDALADFCAHTSGLAECAPLFQVLAQTVQASNKASADEWVPSIKKWFKRWAETMTAFFVMLDICLRPTPPEDWRAKLLSVCRLLKASELPSVVDDDTIEVYREAAADRDSEASGIPTLLYVEIAAVYSKLYANHLALTRLMLEDSVRAFSTTPVRW